MVQSPHCATLSETGCHSVATLPWMSWQTEAPGRSSRVLPASAVGPYHARASAVVLYENGRVVAIGVAWNVLRASMDAETQARRLEG
jgi:hypothetical protein